MSIKTHVYGNAPPKQGAQCLDSGALAVCLLKQGDERGRPGVVVCGDARQWAGLQEGQQEGAARACLGDRGRTCDTKIFYVELHTLALDRSALQASIRGSYASNFRPADPWAVNKTADADRCCRSSVACPLSACSAASTTRRPAMLSFIVSTVVGHLHTENDREWLNKVEITRRRPAHAVCVKVKQETLVYRRPTPRTICCCSASTCCFCCGGNASICCGVSCMTCCSRAGGGHREQHPATSTATRTALLLCCVDCSWRLLHGHGWLCHWWWLVARLWHGCLLWRHAIPWLLLHHRLHWCLHWCLHWRCIWLYRRCWRLHCWWHALRWMRCGDQHLPT